MKRRSNRPTRAETTAPNVSSNVEKWLANARPRQQSLRSFQQLLVEWYQQSSRDLPWRASQLHYPVLVSEMMLQQTTVNTVRRFFPKFLNQFPTVQALASADLQQVLRAWEGLGYYRRARFLHECAKAVCSQHAGKFPTTRAELERLPGIGKYTASALASICSGEAVGVLEANTVRVWARLTATPNPLDARQLKKFWDLADATVPEDEPGMFNQAMMELGALVCQIEQPKCEMCPVRDYCRAYQQGEPSQFGRPKERTKSVLEQHACVYLKSGSHLLMSQRKPDEPWAELWELPRMVLAADQSAVTQLIEYLAARLNLDADNQKSLNLVINPQPMATIKHAIMNFRVTLSCYQAQSTRRFKLPAQSRLAWVKIADLSTRPVSSPQRKLLHKLAHHMIPETKRGNVT